MYFHLFKKCNNWTPYRKSSWQPQNLLLQLDTEKVKIPTQNKKVAFPPFIWVEATSAQLTQSLLRVKSSPEKEQIITFFFSSNQRRAPTARQRRTRKPQQTLALSVLFILQIGRKFHWPMKANQREPPFELARSWRGRGRGICLSLLSIAAKRPSAITRRWSGCVRPCSVSVNHVISMKV